MTTTVFFEDTVVCQSGKDEFYIDLGRTSSAGEDSIYLNIDGIPLKVQQSLMGRSMEVYTRVFALDVAVRHRLLFQMPGADAVAILKGNI